ncbi:hypothetical protein Bbelb_268290 [Branchiostoma belcheri]|nr:hypothetical protein Bbelb_268290 [Branchiostoma belcheri]
MDATVVQVGGIGRTDWRAWDFTVYWALADICSDPAEMPPGRMVRSRTGAFWQNAAGLQTGQFTFPTVQGHLNPPQERIAAFDSLITARHCDSQAAAIFVTFDLTGGPSIIKGEGSSAEVSGEHPHRPAPCHLGRLAGPSRPGPAEMATRNPATDITGHD